MVEGQNVKLFNASNLHGLAKGLGTYYAIAFLNGALLKQPAFIVGGSVVVAAQCVGLLVWHEKKEEKKKGRSEC